MRKSNARNVAMNTGDLMLREIESYVNTKMKKKVLIVTLCPGRRKMNYHVANEHAQPSSNQLTV